MSVVSQNYPSNQIIGGGGFSISENNEINAY
jgi:hypothetical protein